MQESMIINLLRIITVVVNGGKVSAMPETRGHSIFLF